MVSLSNYLERLEALGRKGFVVSVCCGPIRREFGWSVQVLTPTGEEFSVPFMASSFAHAVEIAEVEIVKRGWSVT